MVYASDLQKKVDILNIELADAKLLTEKNKDVNKIISEKDSLIIILQNEINYYKNQIQKEKSNNNNNNFQQIQSFQDNDIINQKLDLLLENYSKENKKLKEKINTLKKQLKDIDKSDNKFDYRKFEKQINLQIDNFNNVISDYNNKLNEALSHIPEIFNQDNKEEAAKYLVSQVNDFMDQNKKLMEENSRLIAKINKLEMDLQYYQSKNLKNEEEEEEEFENNKDESKSIIDLNQRVEDLENIIEKIRNDNANNENNQFMIQDNIKNKNNEISLKQNNEEGLKDNLINVMNELREKDKIIENLNLQLKEKILKQNNKKLNYSMSQNIKNKNSETNDIKNKTFEENEFKNKFEEEFQNNFIPTTEK